MMTCCQKFSSTNSVMYYTDLPFADFGDPKQLAVSASNCLNNAFIVLHNNEMATRDHSPCRKGFTCALLAVGSVLTGVLALAEAVVRLAVAILTSPLLLAYLCSKDESDNKLSIGDIPLLSGLSSLLSGITSLNCGEAAFNMLFTNEQLGRNTF